MLRSTEVHGEVVAGRITDKDGRLIVAGSDGPGNDAFSRQRVSNPEYVFDAQFEYDLQPLLYEAVTAETGATVTHDATNRNALFTFSSTPTGGESYIQTYEHFRYQAGRSQLVMTTFNFIETAADTVKFAGYSDGNNGVELRQTGSDVSIDLLSDTSKGDESVAQADWNIDPLDGTGASGFNLDLTKTQILVIDFQWLGVGRVRVGFDLGGEILYCHEFTHANVQTVAYMQTANLPLRVGMTASDTASTTMRAICSSVTSEGGQLDVGGYQFSTSAAVTAGSGTRTHVLSVRPKTTFNSITNRSKFILEHIDVVVTGSNPVKWELCLGQAITGASYSDVNSTYSGSEMSAGTISGSAAITIAQGYVPASNQSKGEVSRLVSNRYPITLDAAGAVRALGTLSMVATGIGGTSATQAILNWREVR